MVARSQKTSDPRPQRMSRSSLRPTILLVEDSDDDAFFFERILRKSGVEHVLVRRENGREAIDYLEGCLRSPPAHPCPDLIFLDLKLPGVNGFDFLEWLLDRKVEPRLNVAVLSGSDQPEDVQRATSLGASDYLVKPLRLEHLQRRLASLQAEMDSVGNRNGPAK